jgi:hypothetical protein
MPRPKAPPLSCDLKTVSTRIPDAHREALRARAESQGVSMSELLRGQLYEAGDPAETICDAKPRKGLHAPYIEKRKLNAIEAKAVAKAEAEKKKAEADKKRAEDKAKRAERDRKAAENAVDRAEDKAATAKTSSARSQAQRDAQAAKKAADKAQAERDKALQDASVAKAKVREAVAEANEVLVPAGHDPIPVPSDCKTCSKPPEPAVTWKKAALIPTRDGGYKAVPVPAQEDPDAVGRAMFAAPSAPASDQDDEDKRIAAALQRGIMDSLGNLRSQLGL